MQASVAEGALEYELMLPATSDRYTRIFKPVAIGRKLLRSRVFVPGHQPGLAEGGLPGERYIAYRRKLARAGVRMQITVPRRPLPRTAMPAAATALG